MQRTAWLVVIVGGLSATCQGGIITSMVNPSNNHTYYLLTEDSWTASQSEAVSLGGNLVTINDVAENDWVYKTFSNFGGEVRSLWIGLNDSSIEGTFEWVSGEPVTFINWAGPEPNNFGGVGGEDFVHFYTSNYGNAWNDATDTGTDIADRIYGVVEVTNPVPEPSSIALLGIGITGLCGYRWRLKRQTGVGA